MGEQVEVLEDHSDFGAFFADLRVTQLVDPVAALPVAHQFTVNRQPARVDFLQMVDAAQEGALSRTGWADHAHHVPGLDLEVDAAEHLEPAEVLLHRFGFDHRRAAHLNGVRCRVRPARPAPALVGPAVGRGR